MSRLREHLARLATLEQSGSGAPGDVPTKPPKAPSVSFGGRVDGRSDLENLRPVPRSHSCTRCGHFAYSEPTVCYWCRQETRQPSGEPCPDCGDDCVRCLTAHDGGSRAR
jgi:hypothetical protein